MREGTVLAILAFHLSQEGLAVLGLVLVWVVEFLDARVAVDACFALGALLLLGDVGAQLGGVLLRGPAAVLQLLVEVGTAL